MACAPSREEVEAEIKIVLANEFQAHMERNANQLVATFSDNFTSVDKGKIHSPSYDESHVRFQQYFSAVKIIKWDDVQPPILNFSDDKSLAYALIQKQVVTESLQDSKVRDTTYFAWTAIYRKQSGTWKLETITSTREKCGN